MPEVSLVRPLLAAAALALLAPVIAGARGPSTPDERRRAVETTRKLEKIRSPATRTRPGAGSSTGSSAIPDVQVRSCSGPLDVLVEDSGRFGRILYLQSIFGMATFVIEHPRAKDDWVSAQAAGIESVLRAYQSLVRDRRRGAARRARRAPGDAEARPAEAARRGDDGECAKQPDEEGMGPAPRESI